MNQDTLEALLKQVAKPSQYLGNEVNVIKKDFNQAKVKVCLIFPDKYEIGMSHIGLKILYDILNKIPDVVAERCFAPDIDLDELLTKEKIPLFSLESKKPLRDFDLLGFSFTYELTYTNFLNILKLADIPLYQKDRNENHPFILGGGGCMTNAEPIADFLDLAAIGDGEEIIIDIIDQIRIAKDQKRSKKIVLDQLSEIEGIYIPSFFEVDYFEDGKIKEIKALKKGYEKINKRVVTGLDHQPYPTKQIVPSVKLVHDRIGIEIQRGCNRACRFCQAGYIDRPVRQRSPETILKIADESLNNTGIEDISLLSLSAADYQTIVPLLKEMNHRYDNETVAISVPATRTEKLSPELLDETKKVRKSGFTVAPEAGTERMRRVINKGNKVDDLHQAVRNAFSKGWRLLKLYYMVGLPFETDQDVIGIADEANQCMKICRNYTKKPELKLGVSSFVPKPHTPFQWASQMNIEETGRKYHLIKTNLRDRKIRVSHHDAKMSYLEGIFSRGDRRISKLLFLACEQGMKFDEWREHFDFKKWEELIHQSGINPDFYLHRERSFDEILPWDHLFAQMDKKFLWEELERAHDAAYPNETTINPNLKRRGLKPLTNYHPGFTEDCSVNRCSNCGVCDFREIKNKSFVIGDDEIVEKKGHREWYGWNEKANPRTKLQNFTSIGNFVPSADYPSIKLRVEYKKIDSAALMGHLESIGVIKRAIRRLHLPVSYSEGFHPQMKLATSYPLPLGVPSFSEFFDLELKQAIDIKEFLIKMNECLPLGIELKNAEYIDRRSPSLYSDLNDSIFEFDLKFIENKEEILSHCKNFIASNEFIISREKKNGKTKEIDLKQLAELDLDQFPEKIRVCIKRTQDGSVKPVEILIHVLKLNTKEIIWVKTYKVGNRWKNKTLAKSVEELTAVL